MASCDSPEFASGLLPYMPPAPIPGVAYSRCSVLHVFVKRRNGVALFRSVRDRVLALLLFQIFPDPSDFDRCCKLKDRLPSIVVEPTEGEVESGELRWPPEEFLVQEDEQDNCEETAKEDKEQ